ncbi:MAG TPA: prepilin peptidase [Actinomyces sp.]|jgi:leader peptidase (prepilin peptidase)/N-methyltransferase|nr:A24 family peptidase [Acidobacteriota bacterium]HHT40792.1 prepilin peptidase [Actinomyces sp.]
MIPQIITYVFAAIAGIAVSIWAGLGAPEYLEPYFRSAKKKMPRPSQLVYLTVVVQAIIFALGLKDPFLVASVPLMGLASMMVVTDAMTHKLPNVLTFLAAGAGLFGAILGIILRLVQYHATTSLFGILIGMAVWALPMWMLHIIGGGVGRGDVKLAPVIGGWLGLYGAGVSFGGLLTALIIGGGYALVQLLTGKAQWHSAVAFGPAMVLGGLVSWLITGGAVSPW